MGTATQYTALVGPHHLVYGDVGEGFPIVFVHGFPGPESWEGVIARLSPVFRCIVWSPVGMGDAEFVDDVDYSMAGQGRLLCRFLDTLGIARAHFVGNDTGGAVAQAVAAYDPQRVESLVLSDCDALDNWPPLQLKLVRAALAVPGAGALLATLLRVGLIARSGLGFGRLFHDKSLLTPARLAKLRRPFSSAPRRARFRRLLRAMNPATTMAMVAPLQAFVRPTLIIWGKQDAYWGTVWAERLAAVITGTRRVELLDDCGLTCCEERPALFATLLQDFFTQQAGTVSPSADDSPPRWPANSGASDDAERAARSPL